MKRAEAIDRLCAVMSKVNDELTGWSEAADCICLERQDGTYRNEGSAIEFVEAAVFRALAEHSARVATAERDLKIATDAWRLP